MIERQKPAEKRDARLPGGLVSRAVVIRACWAGAALFLVMAVALGTVIPSFEPLGQVVADTDGSLLPAIQAFELARLGAWAWQVTAPVLLRPSWFLPLVLGSVCIGGAVTLNRPSAVPPPRRPR